MQKRRVLFHRSWTKFNGGTSGGQLKVRDAFEHFKHSDLFEPYVFFGPETIWFDNPGNHWLSLRQNALREWKIIPGDVLFFAGHDWKILEPESAFSPPVPVINIAQPRHVNASDPRHNSLQYPALRIAKSSIGKKILEDYGVNGPVYLIPDSIDFSLLPSPISQPDIDLLIVGLKNPVLATSLYEKLSNNNFVLKNQLKIEIQIPPKLPTRSDFLNLMNRAKKILFLPLEPKFGSEGFYLPALEAMAMSKLVICPYAVGNIDFCIPNETCLLPDYSEEAILQYALKALMMDAAAIDKITSTAKGVAYKHDIKNEREQLIKLLHSADKIWNDLSLFRKR